MAAYHCFAQIGCNNNDTKIQGIEMEGVIMIAIVCGLAYWAFKAGKREGLTKGYGAGRCHERAARRWRRRR